MNRILYTILVFTIFIGLSSTYVSKFLVYGEEHARESIDNSHKPTVYLVKTEEGGKSEKTDAVKDPVCRMVIHDVKKALSEEYKGKVYYFCSESCKQNFKKDPASYISILKEERKGKETKTIKDPVCGMIINDVKKALSEVYNGRIYYFCSEACKKNFDKDPKSYEHKGTSEEIIEGPYTGAP